MDKGNFSGTVMMYGSPIHLNTITGDGISEILSKMSKFIERFSSEEGNNDAAVEFSDIRQDVYLTALEGIYAYDPMRNTQLSTFLHRHVNNRMSNLRRKRRCYYMLEDELMSSHISLEDRFDIWRDIKKWSKRWRHIVFRVMICGESVTDVACDEGMPSWKLTRMIKKHISTIKYGKKNDKIWRKRT
jgi:DNA-directed RNA polymerase specialized sigma24 family protein